MNRQTGTIAAIFALLISAPAFAGTIFDTGNLVVSVEGCGIETGLGGAGCAGVANGTGTGSLNSTAGGYGDNQAGPLTLFQFTPTGTYVNSLVLPQTTVAGGTTPSPGNTDLRRKGRCSFPGTVNT